MRFLHVVSGKFRSMAYGPDSRYLASGHGGGAVRLWDLSTATQVAGGGYADQGRLVNHLAFSPDGRALAVAGNRECSLWRVETGHAGVRLSSLGEIPSTVSPPFSGRPLAFSPDAVMLWLADGPLLHLVPLPALAGSKAVLASMRWYLGGLFGDMRQIALHPNGRTAANVTSGDRIDVWDLKRLAALPTSMPWNTHWMRWRDPPPTGKPIARLIVPDGHCGQLYFSADGSRLLAVRLDELHLWDVASWEPLPPLKVGGLVRAAAISPDGRSVMAATSGREVKMFDADAGSELAVFPFDLGPISRLAFAPDGLTAAACGGGKRLAIWDVE